MSEVKMVGCSHVSENSGNGNYIKLVGDEVLHLCFDCTAMVRDEILRAIMTDALKEVFQATVAKELR